MSTFGKWPRAANAPNHGIMVRDHHDNHKFVAMTEADQSYIDDTLWPEFRHTKHVNTIRQTSDGAIVPVTNFASEALALAAGQYFGLIDLVSRPAPDGRGPFHSGIGVGSQRATFYGKAGCVAYWLLTPATLDPVTDIWVHHALDTVANRLHPARFVVNSTSTNAIGKVTDFTSFNAGLGNTNEFVIGNYISGYYRTLPS